MMDGAVDGVGGYPRLMVLPDVTLVPECAILRSGRPPLGPVGHSLATCLALLGDGTKRSTLPGRITAIVTARRADSQLPASQGGLPVLGFRPMAMERQKFRHPINSVPRLSSSHTTWALRL